MKKINFTNATVTAQASVEIDGVSHDVTSAVIEGGTLPTPDNINQLQNNVEEAILNPVVESIKSKNLVNEIVTGYTLTGSGGIKVEATQFVTGFMEVEEGKTYTSQGFKGANGVENNYKDWYTADKTFISNTNDKTATAPANAKFCRMNGVISTSSNMQLEEGNTATSYTSFKRYGYNSKESMGSIIVDDIRSKNLLDENGAIILGYVGFPVYLEAGKTYTISSNLPIYWFKISNNRDGERGGEWLAADGYTEYTFICTKSYPYAFIGIDKDNPYNLPSNVEAYANYKFQIEEGNTATSYTPFKRYGYNSKESMGSIIVDDINCKNLFNKNNVLIGEFINLSGVQIASENMCMTNYYIEVNPNTEYTFSSNVVNYLYIAEYNSSKEFIKSTGIDGTDKEITITTDIGTKYVIASCSKHYLDGMQFELGSTATNYSEYKKLDTDIYSFDTNLTYNSASPQSFQNAILKNAKLVICNFHSKDGNWDIQTQHLTSGTSFTSMQTSTNWYVASNFDSTLGKITFITKSDNSNFVLNKITVVK